MLNTGCSRDNVFLGSMLLASYACNEGWRFYVSDHLATPRFATDASAVAVAQGSRKYWPFGEPAVADVTNQRHRFAAMERDAESNSRYYDHARSHDFTMGRFLSPDKVGGRVANPQSWNRYTYALNNPLKYVDPDGHQAAPPSAPPPTTSVMDLILHYYRQAMSSMGMGDAVPVVWQNGRFSTATPQADKSLQTAVKVATVAAVVAGVVVPQKAVDTLTTVEKTGDAPAGFVGGKDFKNDGRDGGQVLPKQDASGDAVTYKEYDVDPKVSGTPRNAERIVVGSDGTAYYTNDHYKTFTPIERP